MSPRTRMQAINSCYTFEEAGLLSSRPFFHRLFSRIILAGVILPSPVHALVLSRGCTGRRWRRPGEENQSVQRGEKTGGGKG